MRKLLIVLAVLTATASAQVPGIFSHVESTTGYQVNGSAGTAGQALCSDGTLYSTPCTLSIGTITGITANSPLTGGGTSGSVSLGMATSGVTAGSYTATNITVDQYGRVTTASNSNGGTTGIGSSSGCSFGNDGNGVGCGPVTVLIPAMADSTYTAICSANYNTEMITTTSALPALGLSWSIASSSQITVYEAVSSGSATGYGLFSNYGVTITCIAHHA